MDVFLKESENINIVLQFDGAIQKAAVWAGEERYIDFRNEPERAARCTVAYAAMELKEYLSRTLTDTQIKVTSQPDLNGFNLWLETENLNGAGESFEFIPRDNSLCIKGSSRTGVLYGVYEFLRLQGWRWYAPGKEGEIVPSMSNGLILPDMPQMFAPAMSLGRGFEFEGMLKESEDLWIWMARNRLNLSGYRPATAPLQNKLGMSMKTGGHIFENILDPDHTLPSGKTLWDEHEAWYGLPECGTKKKEDALKTQFCVSQKDLLEFLSKELLSYITGEWNAADRIDVWTFDTWGGICTCDECKSMGNGTDQALHFLSAVRNYLNQARHDGRIDHDVKLVLTAYEGTSTLQPPQKEVPQNLIDAGDYIVFCPILRCYEHDFDHPGCSCNTVYQKALNGWQKNGLPVMILEYYNVSKFEDLPLVFTERISSDIPYYFQQGAKGITYMHLPMVGWAMRTLTQLLYAQLAWDPKTDTDQLVEEYFQNWYGEYADEMRQVYRLIEEAWARCASWRAWGSNSILYHLLVWNGCKPLKPLDAGDHFQMPEGVEMSGRQSVQKLTEAMKILDEVRKRDKMEMAKKENHFILHTDAPVNPVEIQKQQQKTKYELRLGEDKRLLSYGLDTMMLMTELAAYYNALYNDEKLKSDELWGRIEALEEKMDGYYMPITFEHPKVGLKCKDALTRTQLREVIRRCRKYRINYGG